MLKWISHSWWQISCKANQIHLGHATVSRTAQIFTNSLLRWTHSKTFRHHRHWWNHSRCARFLYDVLNSSCGSNGLLLVRTICIFECIITTRWKKWKRGRLILITSDMLRFTLIDHSSLGNPRKHFKFKLGSLLIISLSISSSFVFPLHFLLLFQCLFLSRHNVPYLSRDYTILNFALFNITNIWIMKTSFINHESWFICSR